MNDYSNLEELVKQYIYKAQKDGLCDQCVRPWHDGLCECKGPETEEAKAASHFIGGVVFSLDKIGVDIRKFNT